MCAALDIVKMVDSSARQSSLVKLHETASVTSVQRERVSNSEPRSFPHVPGTFTVITSPRRTFSLPSYNRFSIGD